MTAETAQPETTTRRVTCHPIQVSQFGSPIGYFVEAYPQTGNVRVTTNLKYAACLKFMIDSIDEARSLGRQYGGTPKSYTFEPVTREIDIPSV